MAGWLALFVGALCLAFFVSVARQYAQKRQPHVLYWTVSLALAAVAALAYVCCLWITPRPAGLFRLYYVCGALAMPAVMGLGSLGLVLRAWTTHLCAAVVAACVVAGAVGLGTSPIDTRALATLAGGPGVGVIQGGWWLPLLIALNTFGAVAVFGVAVWSAVRTLRGDAPARCLVGHVCLAAGILILSVAGSAARMGWPGMFWFTMAVGWTVTFVGYVLLTPVAVSASARDRARIA